MFKKNNGKNTISVSNLSRYWADEEGFEHFISTSPNKKALRKGQQYHDYGLFSKIPKLVILTLLGGCAFVTYYLFNNVNIL